MAQIPNPWDLGLWEVQAHASLCGHCVNTCWLACLSKFSGGSPWGPITTQVHGRHSAVVGMSEAKATQAPPNALNSFLLSLAQSSAGGDVLKLPPPCLKIELDKSLKPWIF